MAGGMGSRYGGLKQVDSFGPNNEAILDYSIYDAISAGFNKIIILSSPKLQDYFKALTSFLHINTTRFKNLKFFDIDVENLVKEEVKKNFFNKSSFFGILNYFFFSRLRNQNIEVPLVIDWHENQPFDRGFNFGIHNFEKFVKSMNVK